jgi:hypothetical protein
MRWKMLVLLAVFVGSLVHPSFAQTGGEGSISGTVQDASGAVIPNAVVTARNVEKGVETTRATSTSGVYQVSPLIVGTYTVTVTAAGFQGFTQQNVVINEGQSFGLNVVLKPGNQTTMITVSEAPPQLDTASATLGGTISSKEFTDLPLLVAGGQQRDVTSFSSLLPGAQNGARSSLISGTANLEQEVYLDGIPLTTANQLGDNRPIFNVIPAEGIGQIGATTSGQSVEYQGAGSINYNLKSGTNDYHGTVADFVRNTLFDTWGFTAPIATKLSVVNGVATTVPVGKPIDHQNEFTASGGGPIRIPHLYDGRDKLFFFAAFDKTGSRQAPNYAAASVPTLLMRAGDFTEVFGTTPSIFDPSTQSCAGSVCTRSAFMGLKNGVATPNVIPTNEISPIAQNMQQFLPAPTVAGIQNNYLGGIGQGYQNFQYSFRLDYTKSAKQTIAASVGGGQRHAVPYTTTSFVLPLPYLGTTASIVVGHWVDFSDSYTFNSHLVNQFKFGFMNFGGPPLRNITQGTTQYEAQNLGITFNGLPANGQASTEFPSSLFSGPNGQSQWGEGAAGATSTAVMNNYTEVDNLLWIKGKHAMTFGVQVQRLEGQQSTFDGPTSTITFNWNTNETAQESGSSYASGTGYAYSSYLLGAVNSTGVTVQPFSDLGARYRTFSPYFQDDFKVTPKLTLNLGLRWDYYPTYQEVLGRYSFLNPNLTNPVTGNKGALQFAGNSGGSGVSCNCATPVPNYLKNFGPRVGFAYQIDSKTVVRGAFDVVYSHGGGTGGNVGAALTGPSQLGFTSSPSFADGAAGTGAGPAFYLNTSTAFTALGLANANFGGPGYSVPAITPPGAISQTLNVGNTVSAAGAFIQAGAAPGAPDLYLAARAPEFNFWNFGMQRQLTSDIAVTVNYAGSESHFIAGAANMRGLQSGQINPIYYALGSLLNQPATTANLAAANTLGAASGLPTITLPYPGFGLAAATTAGSGKATIGQALTWMPQFSSTTDTFGNQSANAVYHSLQLSLSKRVSHGLTFNLNYTYSHNIDDAGTQRSGWAIPGNRLISGQSWKQNRIDRSTSTNSVPEHLVIYGVYQSPFGKNGLAADNRLVRYLAGDWTLSGIFTYTSGTPLALTSSACTSSTQPTAGTCEPDLNPNYQSSTIRENGSWGHGITAKTLTGGTPFIAGYVGNTTPGMSASASGTTPVPCASSTTPFCNANAFMFGDAPRTAPFGLRNPSVYNLNMSIRRSFNITPERVKFIFAVDCQNVTNKVTFGGIQTNINTATFGTVTTATSNTASRDFQFSGRITF